MEIENIVEELKNNKYNFEKTINKLYDEVDLQSEIDYFKYNKIDYNVYKKNQIESNLRNDNDCRFFFGKVRLVFTQEQYELVSENLINKEDISIEDTVRYDVNNSKYLPIRLENKKANEVDNDHEIIRISPLLFLAEESHINDILNMKENDILKIITATEEREEGFYGNVVKDIEIVKYDLKNEIIKGMGSLHLYEVVEDKIYELLTDDFYHDKNLYVLEKDIVDNIIEKNTDELKKYSKDIEKFFVHFNKCINPETKQSENKKQHKLVQKQVL